MGIPVELWRARIGSFHCSRGATPKGHYNGVFVDRLARARDRPAAYSRQSNDQLVACSHSNTYDCPAAILLLKVAINGSYVLLLASRSLLARILKMAAMMESLKLSSSTASFLYSADGGVMRVVLVTASLTGEGVTPDAIIQLLSIIQFRGNWYQAGTSSKQYGYQQQQQSVVQCTMRAERLLATLVYLMLIVAGDIELNPGPTLSDRPTMKLLISLSKSGEIKPHVHVFKEIEASRKAGDLAEFLLNDPTSVKLIKNDISVPGKFVRAIFEQWLEKNDDDKNDLAPPRTWGSLADCIESADLPGALAKAIRDACNTYAPHLPDHTHSPHLTHSASQVLGAPQSVTVPPFSPHLPQSASQALGPTHSTLHPIDTYQRYLKDLYSTEYPDYSKPQFTHHHRPKQIVNLVLVDMKKDNEVDELQRECLLNQLHGDIDLIKQKKTPLTIDQIGVLADGGGTAHRILIEGAPGIGKTTFLWHVCHQWAVGKLLQQWELVVLVQLRDKIARTSQCLSDLLYHPDDNISEAVYRIIKRQEGANVLIIFDGYDELSNDQRTDSIFLEILQQKSRFLRKATVLVSSRPLAATTLPHQFKNSLDQHVEILGFSEQDIKAYLTSALCQDNPDMLKDLKSYIFTQPFISSVLYNPLHCTIVTELYLQYWQRGKKGLAPSTLTQLYEALVVNLLRRQLESDIDDLSELPSDVCHQLNQLAKLAAKGIEQEQYIFDDNVPSDTLGLMHSVKQLHDCRARRSTSHCFTHLTLQEFLAARHWSQLPPQQLTKVLQRQNLFPIQQYFIWKGSEGGMELSFRVSHWVVLLFLVGLTNNSTELITADQVNFVTGSQTDDQLVHPSLFQLLFESQSPQLVPTILSGKRFLILNYTSPLDYFATGYCIAHSDATTSWYVHFDDSPQSFQAFSHGLHYSPTTTYESTIELSLVTNNSLSPYFEIFPSLYPYTQAITVLSLHGGLCSSNESVSVASVLQQLSHYCPRLRKLTLPRLQPLSLVPQLPQLTLEELCLFLPLMKDESVLGHHLQQCLALNDLTLAPVNKETDITPSLACISPLLAGQIERLVIAWMSINSGCTDILIRSLTSYSSLRKLRLFECTISSSEYHHLITAIATSNLTHFTTDRSLHVEVSVAKGLATLLTHSKTLEFVDVKENDMCSESATILAEAMNHSSVRKLEIGHVKRDTVPDCSLYPTDRVFIFFEMTQ